MPWWAWVFPALSWAMLGAAALGVADASSLPVVPLDATLPGGAVFAAVHHAEVAARVDRLQTSPSLASGSALATIGPTIPAVAAMFLLLGFDLVLGLEAKDTVLLVPILFVAVPTLGTGRTTVLQGATRLVVFAVFLFLAASP